MQERIDQGEASAIGSLGDMHHPIILNACVFDLRAVVEMPTDAILGVEDIGSTLSVVVISS